MFEVGEGERKIERHRLKDKDREAGPVGASSSTSLTAGYTLSARSTAIPPNIRLRKLKEGEREKVRERGRTRERERKWEKGRKLKKEGERDREGERER